MIFASLILFPTLAFGALRVVGNAGEWLGEFPAGESRGAVFTLRNDGAETERIRALSRSCDCAEVSASTNEVAPGASVTVTVRTLPRKEPGPFSVSVYVVTFSRDPASRVIRLAVTGRGVDAKSESACGGRARYITWAAIAKPRNTRNGFQETLDFQYIPWLKTGWLKGFELAFLSPFG